MNTSAYRGEKTQTGAKNMSKQTKNYVADFETRAGIRAQFDKKTWVWAWAICSLDDIETVEVGNDIFDFIDYVKGLGNCTIYFHNLRFDGSFILSHLFCQGFTHREREQRGKYDKAKKPKLGYRQFSTIIGPEGQYYEIDVCLTSGKVVKFCDSLKKLPFSVAQIAKDFKTSHTKLELDYNLDREPGHTITEQEKKYIENDVQVIAEALGAMISEGHEKLTIGSDCLEEYRNLLGGNSAFRKIFPILSREEDVFVRRSYRGGYCYLHRPGRYSAGITVDANSHYPSSMHSKSGNPYPYGKGAYYQGFYQQDAEYPLWVGHGWFEFSLKPGHLPSIQLKKTFGFADNEYVRETHAPVEMTMTSVDWELMLEQYDVYSAEWVDGFKYKAATGLFDCYIDKYMEIKMHATGAVRTLAKLLLNNLYGKFAQSLSGVYKVPHYDEVSGTVRMKTVVGDERKGVYVPVGTFCTAYARATTIRLGQRNYDRVIYFDTDSMHLMGHEDPVDVPIHDYDLCCWKVESHWDDGVFLRQKTYMEHMGEGKYANPWYDLRPGDMGAENKFKEGPHWEIRCAGMDAETKRCFMRGMDEGKYTPDSFDYGLCIEGYKLRPTVVQGGTLLIPTKFEIKLPN